ncbi:SHOCT domain-containing protein [Ornithinimicrobium sp. LYQ103]|uniref:SHOCT domain-containing protein n=1 Tax=Ornithinimicrobium sp. LYQ103 TaxID=3378796 RepID=UPI0038552044
MIWFWTSLLVAGLALVVITLVRVLAGGLDDGSARSAREILDVRYAAGELTTEEYEHRRRVLSQREEGS